MDILRFSELMMTFGEKKKQLKIVSCYYDLMGKSWNVDRKITITVCF